MKIRKSNYAFKFRPETCNITEAGRGDGQRLMDFGFSSKKTKANTNYEAAEDPAVALQDVDADDVAPHRTDPGRHLAEGAGPVGEPHPDEDVSGHHPSTIPTAAGPYAAPAL